MTRIKRTRPPNRIDVAWSRTLRRELNSNFLFNSPMGKTAFACGIGFAMQRWRINKPGEWQRLYDELKEFTDAYMGDKEASS